MDKKWEAEKYGLSKITITFLSKRMPVKDAEGGEIGYTSPEIGICLAKEHEIFSMLAADEQRFFRKGVFAHELLHQIFTDFNYHSKMMDSIKSSEKNIFALIANVLEDPAIEYWAKTKFGGSLLTSLKFSIAHIYEQSHDISESKDPFSQFVNALIQFGDMGLVKGSFTFPEAQETFLLVAPKFNEGILEPSGKKRLDIAKEIMEMSRPLWEEIAKEQEEFEKLIDELMKAAGKKSMSGSGSGEDGDPDMQPDEGEKSERRKKTLKKVIKKAKKEDGTSSDGESESASVGMGDSSEDSDESEGDAASKTDGEGEKASFSSSSSGDSSGSSSSDSSSSTSSDTSSDSEEEDEEESEEDAISKDKEMSETDKEEMEKELEKAEEEMRKEMEEEKRDDSVLNSMDLSAGKFVVPADDVLNERPAAVSDGTLYNSIVAEMSTGIANTTRQIRKMITFAQEDTEYATRGKINIKRLNCGKNTARVFDRKRVPNNVADLVVGVAVDLSGSMNGIRIDNARKCCIALAEICNNLGVPIYIMGYTGDVRGHTIYHRHYITWNNTKRDRESLLGVYALCENYDGPSFRYFTEIMRKKNSHHKLLIIISDGAPCGPGYLGDAANKDTAMAIRDARKVCDVLGVAVGNSSTTLLHSFYGNDFLHVSHPSDLFSGISAKLKKFVRKWMDNEF